MSWKEELYQFKIGDRVDIIKNCSPDRCIHTTTCKKKGETGIIKEITRGLYNIKYDDDGSNCNFEKFQLRHA